MTEIVKCLFQTIVYRIAILCTIVEGRLNLNKIPSAAETRRARAEWTFCSSIVVMLSRIFLLFIFLESRQYLNVLVFNKKV